MGEAMDYERDTSGADDAMSGSERTLRVLCHELSGLIDGASRYVELARRGCAAGGTPDDTAKYLATAATALGEAARMLRTVRLGRDEARAPISRLASLRPAGESVDHAVDLARTLAMPRGIEIVCRVDEAFRGMGAVPVFPVVNNALRNALEVTPRGGTIELRAAVRPGPDGGQCAEIVVLDDGPGPSRDAEAHAFELGYSTKSGGSGVGLALARSIINDLGGRIALCSRAAVDGRRGGALIASWPIEREQTFGRETGDSEGRAA